MDSVALAAERWSAGRFKAVLTSRSSDSPLHASPRPYQSHVYKKTGNAIRENLVFSQGLKDTCSRNRIISSQCHSAAVCERLHGYGAALHAARTELANRFNNQRIEKENSEVNIAKQRMRESAQLCKDTRSHLDREEELLSKRARWILLGFDRRRKEEEEELKQCTFSPKLCKSGRPPRTVDLRCFVGTRGLL